MKNNFYKNLLISLSFILISMTFCVIFIITSSNIITKLTSLFAMFLNGFACGMWCIMYHNEKILERQKRIELQFKKLQKEFELSSLKKFIESIKKQYKNLYIDYLYEHKIYNIWHNNQKLDEDEEFNNFVGKKLQTYFYNYKIFNVIFCYDYERSKKYGIIKV